MSPGQIFKKFEPPIIDRGRNPGSNLIFWPLCDAWPTNRSKLYSMRKFLYIVIPWTIWGNFCILNKCARFGPHIFVLVSGGSWGSSPNTHLPLHTSHSHVWNGGVFYIEAVCEDWDILEGLVVRMCTPSIRLHRLSSVKLFASHWKVSTCSGTWRVRVCRFKLSPSMGIDKKWLIGF